MCATAHRPPRAVNVRAAAHAGLPDASIAMSRRRWRPAFGGRRPPTTTTLRHIAVCSPRGRSRARSSGRRRRPRQCDRRGVDLQPTPRAAMHVLDGAVSWRSASGRRSRARFAVAPSSWRRRRGCLRPVGRRRSAVCRCASTTAAHSHQTTADSRRRRRWRRRPLVWMRPAPRRWPPARRTGRRRRLDRDTWPHAGRTSAQTAAWWPVDVTSKRPAARQASRRVWSRDADERRRPADADRLALIRRRGGRIDASFMPT